MNADVKAYNDAQLPTQRAICDFLARRIGDCLSDADDKVWHGGPVWFLNGNPIVGYWVRKTDVQLLFWSGQSFDEPGLQAEGKFKAAEACYADVSQIDSSDLSRWLEKSRLIQWDYKNIVKRRGVLEKITLDQ